MKQYKILFYDVVSEKRVLRKQITFQAESNSEARFKAPSIELSYEDDNDVAVLFSEDNNPICIIKYSPRRDGLVAPIGGSSKKRTYSRKSPSR